MYVAHWDIPKQHGLSADGDMPRNEEGSDDVPHPDSEAELGDDGHRALPRVQDVLREHQSKTGIPKAPDPDALVKHAKKLNHGWDGSVSGAHEINVQYSLHSISKSLSMLMVSLFRMVSASLKALLVQGNVSPRWEVKRESEVSISARLYLSKIFKDFYKERNSWGEGKCFCYVGSIAC